MNKTFKEMVIEKLEKVTATRIDEAFANGYRNITDRTTRAMKELSEIENEYNTALKMIEDAFN